MAHGVHISAQLKVVDILLCVDLGIAERQRLDRLVSTSAVPRHPTSSTIIIIIIITNDNNIHDGLHSIFPFVFHSNNAFISYCYRRK